MTARPVRPLLAGLAVAGLFATTGCGGDAASAQWGEPVSGSASAAAVPSGGAPAPGTVVPASLTFAGKTLDGAPFDAATFAGKPTLLWFWAPWCATCAGQASSVTDLHTQYGDRLGILGIAGLGDNAAMHEFVSDLDVASVPNLDDQAGALWRRFTITEQSTFVLIDRQGAVTHTGYLDDVDLSTKVKSLVG